MFESLNRKRTIMEGVDTEGMEFKKLRDFINTDLPVKGFFFTTNRISGEVQVVVVTETCLVNMPRRAVEQFMTIQETPEMLKAVLEGKLTIEVGDMIKTKQGATVQYNFKG